MAIRTLTNEEKRQLNDIYMGILKKYKNSSGESIMYDSLPRMTMDDARSLSNFELSEKAAKIENDYLQRIENINSNAQSRGLRNSTVVMKLLDRAYEKREADLARLDGMADKLAKRIYAENLRVALSIEKEKSTARSRAIRDFIAVKRLRINVSFDEQEFVDGELYNAYLAWLLQFPPQEAHDCVLQNSLFLVNMGNTKYNALVSEIESRLLLD